MSTPPPVDLPYRIVWRSRALRQGMHRSTQSGAGGLFRDLPQPAGEPRCRNTIHDVVIDADGHRQELPRLHSVAGESGLDRDAPKRHRQRAARNGHTPSRSRARHADGRQRHRAAQPLPPFGVPVELPVEQPPHESGKAKK
jgi:hypothetical protein